MNRTLILVVSTLMVAVGCSSTVSTPVATSAPAPARSSAVADPVATALPAPSPSPRPTASFFAALPRARPVQPVATVPVGQSAWGLTSDGSAIWVWNGSAGVRIDPSTDRVAETFPVPSDPTGNSIAVGAGSIWVCAFDSNTVIRLDAKTGRHLARSRPDPAVKVKTA